MKLSDYLPDFLASRGVSCVFTVAGGACLHFLESIADHPEIEYVCVQHEQAAAMAAFGYARLTGKLGVAVVTSGPGATNLLTGVCCAYFDSLPVMLISGQASRSRLKGKQGVRSLGYQETNVVSIFRPCTKYSKLILDPDAFTAELEIADCRATAGRPGPVLLDIPTDLQWSEIEPDRSSALKQPPHLNAPRISIRKLACLEKFVQESRRPVLVLGAGCQSCSAESLLSLVHRLAIPVLTTWGAADLVPNDHPLLVGTFGECGPRYGNLSVQNADLVLAVGARLDTRVAGRLPDGFARAARKIIVDVDQHELKKFEKIGMQCDLLIRAHATNFVQEALSLSISGVGLSHEIAAWKDQIAAWRKRYPICPPAYYEEIEINPYVFIKHLSQALQIGDVISVDAGNARIWLMQAFEFKASQRLLACWNHAPMGIGLAAIVGAALGRPAGNLICVTGDGGLQLNIQELATIVRQELPIKIFVLNNRGYSSVQEAQDQWHNGRYVAADVAHGLPGIDFTAIAGAYGLKTFRASKNSEIPEAIRATIAQNGPALCELAISARHRVLPQVKLNRPLEDQEPTLSREELLSNLMVPLHPASLK